MTTAAPECPRCRMRMERGFTVDHERHDVRLQHWTPGEPVKSFWSGIKVEKSKSLPIATFRCPKCGLLEAYADRGYEAP